MPESDGQLPDCLVLRPHRRVLSRGADAAQLGLNPDEALEITGLSPGLVRMLGELEWVQPTAELIERAAEHGVEPAEARGLLSELYAGGAVVDAGAARRRCEARLGMTAVVHGDGPLAVGVATALAVAGIGAVHVAANGVVCSPDLGCGYLDRDLGCSRSDAAARAVRRAAPTVRTGPPGPRLVPDIAVIADALVPDPLVATALVARCVPHLSVRLRDGLGVVGPLVLPGRTACLRCLDLHRASRDARWPLVAAQLAGRTGSASHACALATVAFGAAQALLALEACTQGTAAPPTLDATLELDVDSGVVQRRQWAPRADCPCRAAIGTDAAVARK